MSGWLLLAMVGSAWGWEAMGWSWSCDEPIPVALYDPDPERAARLDEAAANTVAAWQGASDCPCFEIEYLGLLDSYTEEDAQDDIPTFVMGDPLGLEDDTEWPWNHVQTVWDEYIVSADEIEWITLDELDGCDWAFVFEAVFGHWLGHTIGLAHSCEEDDVCDDELLREAAMMWYLTMCSDQGSEPMSDDLAGLIAIYGQRASIDAFTGDGLVHHDFASAARVPVEVCFEASAERELGGFVWDFGDGASAEGAEVCHGFEDVDVLDVEVRGLEQPEDCPVASQRLILCDDYTEIEPPLFSASVEAGVLRLDNLLPRVDNACTDTVRWELQRDGEPLDWNQAWDASFELPGAGSYTVVLEVDGVSGPALDEQVIEATGCGCATSRRGTAGWWWLLVGVAPLVRRRSGHSGPTWRI